MGDIFRQGKIRWMFFMLIPIIFNFLRRELSFGPAFFAAWAFFSWIIHDYQYWGCFPILCIAGVMLLSVCVVRAGKDDFARALIVSGTFQACLALLQVCGVNPFFRVVAEAAHKAIGFWGHPTVLGVFLAAAICPALWRGCYYAAGLMALTIMATGSSMSNGTLAVVALLFLWHKASFRAAAALACMGILGLLGAHIFYPANTWMDVDGRWFIWSFGLRALAEHPLFGSGPGAWAGHYIPLYQKEILAQFLYHVPQQLHCDYLDFLVEYGKVAFCILGLAFIQFVRNFRPTWHHAVCAALLVNATANFPLCLPVMAVIFIVCLAHSNGVQSKS